MWDSFRLSLFLNDFTLLSTHSCQCVVLHLITVTTGLTTVCCCLSCNTKHNHNYITCRSPWVPDITDHWTILVACFYIASYPGARWPRAPGYEASLYIPMWEGRGGGVFACNRHLLHVLRIQHAAGFPAWLP